MKILFIIPPWRTCDQIFQQLFPLPLASVLLGTILKEKGHEVTIKDFLLPFTKGFAPAPESFKNKSAGPYLHYGQSIEECKEWLKNNTKEYDSIGLCMCQCNLWETSEILAKYIKEELKKPLVIGGPHVTTNVDFCMRITNANVAVVGEAEEVVEEAFEKSLTENNLIINGISPDIEKLPLPDWDLVNLKEYPPGNRGALSVSRGCPWKCEFCSVYQIFGKRMRRVSREKIKAEILNLWNRGITFFTFIDDNLFFSEKETDKVLGVIEELKEEIPQFKRRAKFYNEEGTEVRVAAIPGLIQRVKDAGFQRIALGIESMNADVVKNIQKPYTQETLKKAMDECQKADVSVRAFYIIGFPGDTIKNVCEGIITLAEYGIGARANNLKLYPNQLTTKKFLDGGFIDKNYDYRLSSWYTPNTGTMDMRTIKSLKGYLRAIGEAAESYGMNLMKDNYKTIQEKFAKLKYTLSQDGKEYTLNGNLFSETTLRRILWFMQLKLGRTVGFERIDKKTIKTKPNIKKLTDIERGFIKAMEKRNIIVKNSHENIENLFE